MSFDLFGLDSRPRGCAFRPTALRASASRKPTSTDGAVAFDRVPKRVNYFRQWSKLPGVSVICSTWNTGGSQLAAASREPPVVVGARRPLRRSAADGCGMPRETGDCRQASRRWFANPLAGDRSQRGRARSRTRIRPRDPRGQRPTTAGQPVCRAADRSPASGAPAPGRRARRRRRGSNCGSAASGQLTADSRHCSTWNISSREWKRRAGRFRACSAQAGGSASIRRGRTRHAARAAASPSPPLPCSSAP